MPKKNSGRFCECDDKCVHKLVPRLPLALGVGEVNHLWAIRSLWRMLHLHKSERTRSCYCTIHSFTPACREERDYAPNEERNGLPLTTVVLLFNLPFHASEEKAVP